MDLHYPLTLVFFAFLRQLLLPSFLFSLLHAPMSLAKAGTSNLLSLNCGIMKIYSTYSVAVVLFTSERCWNGGSSLMKAYNNLALLLRDQCETWPQPENSSEMASTLKLRHFEHLNASYPQLDLILIVLRMLMPAWRTWTFA